MEFYGKSLMEVSYPSTKLSVTCLNYPSAPKLRPIKGNLKMISPFKLPPVMTKIRYNDFCLDEETDSSETEVAS